MQTLERPFPRSARLKDERIWIGEHLLAYKPETIQAKLSRLDGFGITAFLDLTGPGEIPSYSKALEAYGVGGRTRFVHVRKHVPESSPQMMAQAILDSLGLLNALQRQGHTVYIHAKGIGGRLSAFLGCYLVHSGHSATQALQKRREIWDEIRNASKFPVNPITEVGDQAVHNFPQSRLTRLLCSASPTPRYLRDRARGALIGLAVGDAMGVGAELRPRGATGLTGGGPDRLRPGEWTGPTAQALCLATSLIEGTEDWGLRNYMRWWTAGEFSSIERAVGVNDSMRSTLCRYNRSIGSSTGMWDGGDNIATDASALARLAPVPSMATRDQYAKMTWYVTRVTHRAPIVVAMSIYLAGLIRSALDGASKRDLLNHLPSDADQFWFMGAQEELLQLLARDGAAPLHPSYAGVALLNARNAFEQSTDFRSGCLVAAALEGEAPYTAAIYGQLAGAFYGESGIPPEWRIQLARKELIDRYAEFLFQKSLDWNCGPLTRTPRPGVAWWIREAFDVRGDPVTTLQELNRRVAASESGPIEDNMIEREAQARIRVEIGLRELHHELRDLS